MCEPATIMAVTAVVAGGFSAVSQYQQGKAADAAAKYNARQMENEAVQARNVGTEQENEHRRRVAALVSQQRAQFAAQGVDVDLGSPFDIQSDTQIMGEADALRIRSNVGREVSSMQEGATLTRFEGAAARSAGRMGAAGSLIGAASSAMGTGVADKWFTSSSAARQHTGLVNTTRNASVV